jgi:hypothetical protein
LTLGASSSNSPSNSESNSGTPSNLGTSLPSNSGTPTGTPTSTTSETSTTTPTPTIDSILLGGLNDAKSIDATTDPSAIGGISAGIILAAALCAALVALLLRKQRKQKKQPQEQNNLPPEEQDNTVPLSFTASKSINNPLLMKQVKTNKKSFYAKSSATSPRDSQTISTLQDQNTNANINNIDSITHGISSFYKNNLPGSKHTSSPQSRSPEISASTNPEKIDVITDLNEPVETKKPLTITRVSGEQKPVVYTNPLIDVDGDSPIHKSFRKNLDIFEPGKRELASFNAVRPAFAKPELFEPGNRELVRFNSQATRSSLKLVNPLIFDLNKEKVAFPVKKIEGNTEQ